ncbi:hypothetical protein PUN28_004777 [Cardiocondyla obscurior]|uniref:Uncharacterized protein n=1 Tax=Cardiocondyla obscurior TaxID=286306 RepID=A0AAW2GF68_9HYME
MSVVRVPRTARASSRALYSGCRRERKNGGEERRMAITRENEEKEKEREGKKRDLCEAAASVASERFAHAAGRRRRRRNRRRGRRQLENRDDEEARMRELSWTEKARRRQSASSKVDEEGRKNDRGVGGRRGRGEKRPDEPLALSRTRTKGKEDSEATICSPPSFPVSFFYSSAPLFLSSSPLCCFHY